MINSISFVSPYKYCYSVRSFCPNNASASPACALSIQILAKGIIPVQQWWNQSTFGFHRTMYFWWSDPDMMCHDTTSYTWPLQTVKIDCQSELIYHMSTPENLVFHLASKLFHSSLQMLSSLKSNHSELRVAELSSLLLNFLSLHITSELSPYTIRSTLQSDAFVNAMLYISQTTRSGIAQWIC